MNRGPGKTLRGWIATSAFLLPLLAAAQPLPGNPSLNFRPQPESNARGVYPQAPPLQTRNWATQNPDGSRSFHQSWNYGYPPGYPAAPQQAPPATAPTTAPAGAQPPQSAWPGGAPPYGYGQPQQPWVSGFAAPQAPSWPGQSSPQQGWPGGYGGAQNPSWPSPAPAAHAATAQPRLEVRLADHRAYVHQKLILTLEVISESNLRTLAVELPQSDEVVLRELGETTAESRNRGGRREIVNRQHYQLTPVEPADPSVRPWLPLFSLELDARLLNDEKVAEGEPLTLVLEQTAEGMSGAQLPSLEGQLKSPHHRIYREKTETEGRIDKSGKLIGRRMDRFTLVPQEGNRVQIPAVRVDWWNAERRRKETAIIPARLLGSGELFDDLSEKFTDMPFAGLGWVFWVPMILFAFFAGLYWSWVWARSRSLSQGLRNWLGLVLHPLSSRVQPLAAKLSPQRQLHRVRRLFANLLPRSYRLWYCVRAADQETDPDDWAQVLRFLLNRRLGITAQRPMAQLAEEIIRLHRPKRPDELRHLLRQLEAGLFGDHPAISDFARWKRAFKRQIRPNPLRLLLMRVRRTGSNPHQLPALNPPI